MELVVDITKPKCKNPRIQLLYSTPKTGKTTIVSKLPNHLIVELEPAGADYVEGRIQNINKASEFNEFLDLIKNSKEKVCDYLVIDTVTKLDEWSEIVGTYEYMGKPQGKKFNREGESEFGKPIYHTDKRFESVHTLGQGFGYKYSRDVMIEWYDKLQDLITLNKVSYIILLAHVKDKLIESKNGDTVEHIDINLTGKVKAIYTSRVDAVGHMYREQNKAYISYTNDAKIVCGGRCSHLEGSILISEKLNENEIQTYWENIYK